MIRSNSISHTHISPFEYMVEQPSRSSTSYLRDNKTPTFIHEEGEQASSMEGLINDLRVHRNGIVDNNDPSVKVSKDPEKLSLYLTLAYNIFR